ncbi:amino acid ABC transporter permease [Cytobacillus purgationiresistens]|uniref:Glutamine transport system permease protein n=1 Tax=Cytobacillus purgationiresistens TaxID=863449 RepID=A0ABU0AN60_9BACI|nr:amino acid ABC transporter permease [Cytobacillus purgationiresistens]MDQ0272716.1 putative glutamine transport system permease protein [Cytobacillus purgationiresistens]
MDFAGAYSIDHLKFLLEGFGLTLYMAVIAIICSFIIGAVIAIIRYAKVPVISQILAVIVEIIRNLPLLLLIFFTYLALPDIGIKFNPIPAAIIALTIFEAAMLSEIIRSGLNSIDKGQIEAARSSGLNYIQTLWHIILPQALRRMVPPIVSQFISLLKDTSLAVVVSVPELLHSGQIIYGQKQAYLVPILLLIVMMYFVVNYALSILSRRLEVKNT